MSPTEKRGFCPATLLEVFARLRFALFAFVHRDFDNVANPIFIEYRVAISRNVFKVDAHIVDARFVGKFRLARFREFELALQALVRCARKFEKIVASTVGSCAGDLLCGDFDNFFHIVSFALIA